jgi:hypothetical protein
LCLMGLSTYKWYWEQSHQTHKRPQIPSSSKHRRLQMLLATRHDTRILVKMQNPHHTIPERHQSTITHYNTLNQDIHRWIRGHYDLWPKVSQMCLGMGHNQRWPHTKLPIMCRIWQSGPFIHRDPIPPNSSKSWTCCNPRGPHSHPGITHHYTSHYPHWLSASL